LVEGYTDVITLNEHGIKNVVASSGTALTPGQIKILKRYGDTLVMIYDSDAAGQNAMMRGIDIALSQGMNVKILELPDGEDPDSFVKQFGKESFEKQKREQTLGFIDFLVSRLILEGKAEDPEQRNELINRILESIAHIPLKEDQPVYVQALHEYTSKYTGKSDRDLFTRLDRIINKKRNEKNYNAFDEKEQKNDLKESKVEKKRDVISYGKKKQDEKELIRLMITYGRDMVEYICSFTNEKLFEDDELKTFYSDILGRYKEEKEISIQVYSGKQEPFPRLVGDVLLEQYAPSERHQEKVGLKYEKDKNPYRTAKSTMKAMELAFFKRKLAELSERFGRSDSQDEKKKIMTSQTKIQEKVTKLTTTYSDDHYPDPPQESDNVVNESKFEYKMKGDRN
ncbi:MAG TPA: DNA primase, partial [Balneola sp.]|nr:DNA primase [Balneola sp.]